LKRWLRLPEGVAASAEVGLRGCVCGAASGVFARKSVVSGVEALACTTAMAMRTGRDSNTASLFIGTFHFPERGFLAILLIGWLSKIVHPPSATRCFLVRDRAPFPNNWHRNKPVRLAFSFQLEAQLHRSLQNAWRRGADRIPKSRAANVAIHRRRPVELGMVEEVESFHAEQH